MGRNTDVEDGSEESPSVQGHRSDELRSRQRRLRHKMNIEPTREGGDHTFGIHTNLLTS